MRIAISSNGQNLSAQLDPRFGRCNYFLLIEIDDLSFDVVENSSRTASGGAGIQAAQLIVSKGITTVITGNCGPNATQVFTAAGINLITGQFGTVKDVVEMYKSGKLKPKTDASNGSDYGMRMGGCKGGGGMGGGRGMGGGGGRGMGGGGGSGMGGGRGMGGARG